MLEFLILYISSDIENAKQLSSKLKLPSGIHFIFLDSGVEALSVLTDKEIKLIILSKELSHKMNGIEVCELLMKKKATSSLPVIFLHDNQEKLASCSNIVKYLDTVPNIPDIQAQILSQYQLHTDKDALQIEKGLILSIVNHIHSPIFIIDHNNISFANQYG